MKMNTIIPLLGLLAIAMVCLYSSCAKDYGEPTTKTFAINGSYNALEVSSAFEVTVSDQVTDVVVTVGEKALDKVKVEVKNGTLHIGFNWLTNYVGTATAVIPANANLRELDLSGGSKFTGDLTGSEIEIDLSGASIYYGNVIADEIDIDLSGASEATLTGNCQTTMDITLSGASDLFASGLGTQTVEGTMSGAATAYVTCCSRLQVALSGASTLYYGTTSPDCHPVVNCTTSGASTVSPR